MRKIAFEEHYATPELMALRKELLSYLGVEMNLPVKELQRTTQLACDIENERLPSMDRNEIAMEVLMCASNGLEGVADPARAASIARDFNDCMAAVTRKYPERFKAFALLPLQNPNAAAAELERCVNQYGMIGAHFVGRRMVDGVFMDDPTLSNVWACANQLKVSLYIHPTETCTDSATLYTGCPALNGPTWSWGVDTATYTLRFIFNGMFDRYPNVKLICGHMGEMLPYNLGRIDARWKLAPMGSKNQRMPSDYFKENIYFTISGNFYEPALKCAIASVGADRILFGTDYPFESNDTASQFIETANISLDDKKLICYKNAEKLLGMRGNDPHIR